jgi:ABC-type glutathione transport system ATPase component
MRNPTPSLLRVRDLSIELPAGAERRHATHGVSFDLAPSEILCIVGESGSGKSLTALAIMGLLPNAVRRTGGSIILDGDELATLGEEALRRIRGTRIGMIFQEPMTALNPLMRVGRQVEEVFAAHGRHRRGERRRRVLDLLEAMGLPDPDALYRAYPTRLSGGQRQRIMIAMALALEPALLIADEPTTALDVTTQAQILALIKTEQARRGMGVLFITHDFGVVAEIADRVAIMQSGRIVETGSARDVLNAPRDAYTRALIAAVPEADATAQPALAGEPLLQVDDLAKSFLLPRRLFGRRRTRRAVDCVSLQIRPGETLGLVGESGSGKSTVGHCIVRLVEAESGSIRFDGVDIRPLKGAALRRLRKRIQIVFQDPFASLNPRRKIGSIVMQGPLIHGSARGAAAQRVAELLRLVGLDAGAVDRYPHEFSGGQRQRIGIARALALAPDLIVADEPVSALDVSVQAQVLALLRDIRMRLGLAMLFITHDLRVAAQICDTIAVMKDGRIVEYGPTAAVFRTPQHPYTRQLLEAIPGRHWRPIRVAPDARHDLAV